MERLHQPSRRDFASDNASGVHPRILEALATANGGHVSGYGDDPYTAAADELMRAAFGPQAQAFYVWGGTGANVAGLAAVTRPFEAIVCADCAHLWTNEGGAPERFLGTKLLPVPTVNGKLTVDLVEEHLPQGRGVHFAQPKVISITQPTEWGTVYTPGEMALLAEHAHRREMLLHVDGARFANAAAALDLGLGDIAGEVGVDVLSFGGTKNGLMGGEAVVFPSGGACAAASCRKQTTQLASKMRFISAQFVAYLEDELWRETASHANAMAARLGQAISAFDQITLECPVESNALFPRLDPALLAALQAEHHFYTWDARRSIARWMTGFDTTEEDINALVATIRRECGRPE